MLVLQFPGREGHHDRPQRPISLRPTHVPPPLHRYNIASLSSDTAPHSKAHTAARRDTTIHVHHLAVLLLHNPIRTLQHRHFTLTKPACSPFTFTLHPSSPQLPGPFPSPPPPPFIFPPKSLFPHPSSHIIPHFHAVRTSLPP